MDKDKQPGIKFNGIILVKESFWRNYNIPDNPEVELNINMNTNDQEENYSTQLDITVLMKYDNTDVLKLETSFVGQFSIEDKQQNMNITNFLDNHSPALMFPFIREHIAMITQKAGVGPVLLPPINILALIKQNKMQLEDNK